MGEAGRGVVGSAGQGIVAAGGWASVETVSRYLMITGSATNFPSPYKNRPV